MRMGIWRIAAVLLLAGTLSAAAQSACDDALREAEKTYDLGLFEDVPGQLAPCLGIRLSRPAAIRVHSLLARAYLQNDETAKARKEVATLLRLDSTFEGGASPRFAALVEEVRREELTVQVASVSKTSESLREAPATVIVITGEEIRRRGYLDLEQLLHDLPGFDISRLNGPFYSTIAQRGYNDAENDRNLLLVDGIEQNELTEGAIFLSRQYPLTNVDRVEVIYGPASTIYGANAYTGVISIITRPPEAVIAEGKSFGLIGQVTGGGYGGGSVDVTAAGRDRSGAVSWTVTGNYQAAKERDLSRFAPWDYTYDSVDYRRLMRLPGTPFERQVLCSAPSPYIQCDAAGISLTDAGVRLVRELDSRMVRENDAGFDDRSRNWWLSGMLRLANLTLGVQTWRSYEGLASAFGNAYGGGTGDTPRQTAVYLKYSLPVGGVKLNVFSRYIQTGRTREEPQFQFLHLYASGFLSMYSLVPPCRTPIDPKPVDCAPAKPWMESILFGNLSNQFRTEVNGTWEPSERLSVVTGIEHTLSAVQSALDQAASGPGQLIVVPLEEPEQIEHADTALYAQGSWKPRSDLRVILAGRVTHNQILNKPGAEGFGTLFTPRAAVVWSPLGRRLVLKAIYSEAFKDPTNAQKFGVTFLVENAYRSNGLKPETVRNVELTAGWEATERLSLEGTVYQSGYHDVVGYGYALQPDGTPVQGCQRGCEQWQNRDQFRVRGLQLTARYELRDWDFWGNYTHTDAVQTNARNFFNQPIFDARGRRVEELRVHGIAANRANLGAEAMLLPRLRAGVRVHYVGDRPIGPGTTLTVLRLRGGTPIPFTRVEGHTTADAVVSYDLRPSTTLQLTAFNVFDTDYYDPGTDPRTVPAVLQAGRTVHLRLRFALQ